MQFNTENMFYSFLFLILISVVVCNADPNRSDSEKRLLLQQSGIDVVQEVLNLKQQVQQQQDQIHTLTTKLDERDKLGSTYTRWGRTTCPGNGTTLAYSGYMGGTYHGDKSVPGTGANYLCLAGQPTWDHYSVTANNVIRVTGVQYEFYAHFATSHDLKDFFGSDIHNKAAPCAVCRSTRITNIMIPGRKDCYPGWTMEYSGYLVGAYSGFDDASEYICLDRRPEVVVNSGDRHSDNVMYFVEATCGQSLECPPYVHDRELACVVCSM